MNLLLFDKSQNAAGKYNKLKQGGLILKIPFLIQFSAAPSSAIAGHIFIPVATKYNDIVPRIT